MAIDKGISFYGVIGDIDDIAPYSPVGMQLVLTAAQVETSLGVYDWTELDDAVDYCGSHGMQLIVRININQGSPSFILSSVGTYTTSGHPETGPYPYQLNPAYQSWVSDFWTALTSKINDIENDGLHDGIIVAWGVSTGSTGDKGFYKGTLVDYEYLGDTTFDESEQAALEKDMWDMAETINATNSSFCKLLLNPGNDGEDYDLILSDYAGSYMKSGETSHNILPVGETVLLLRECVDSGEIQNIFQETTFQTSYGQNLFVLFSSIIALKLDIPLVPKGLINQCPSNMVVAMGRAFTFINEFHGLKAVDKKGIIILRDAIDFLDDTRFPEGAFGAVIDPAQLGTYNTRVANIDAAPYGAMHKTFLYLDAKREFINPSRIALIMASVPDANYDDADIYNNDAGFGLLKNYESGIEQINPDNTSYGVYRVGTSLTSDIYGKFARAIDDESFFKFTDPSVIGNSNYTLRLRVLYKNSFGSSWYLKYNNGVSDVLLGPVESFGSGNFTTATFNISDLQGGGVMSGGGDFSILKDYTASIDPIIQYITFDSVVENTSSCNAVAFTSSTSIPDAVVNVPYEVDISISGDTPIDISNIVKPSWMSITVVGSEVQLRGTPTSQSTGIQIKFSLENCGGIINLDETIDITSGCVDVSFGSTTTLPNGQVGEPYSFFLALFGTTPFSLNSVIKPSWMTITLTGASIEFSGTPDAALENINVSFDVTNCTSGSVSFDETFDVGILSVPTADNENLYLIPSGIGNINTLFSGINWKNVDYYYIEVLSNGAVIATTPLYKNGCCCGIEDNKETVRIIFLNYCNTYDGINFSKPSIIHESVSESYTRGLTYPLVKTDTGIERFNVISNDIYECFNFCYTEEDMDWLQELFDSPKAFIQWKGIQNQSNSHLPIVILDTKFEKQKNINEYFYKVTIQFKLSNETFAIRN